MTEPVTAYIGLGSNLEHPEDQLRSARKAIAALAGLRELSISSLYRSAPMGPSDQPDYVNAVMAVSTTLEPLQLLDALQAIEQAQGRVRSGERWGPRTLDLDLLLYGEQNIDLPRLNVPHPGLAQREFVLYPLAEIAPPQLNVPGHGALGDLLKQCPDRGIRVIGRV
nr:2-amino-4-hydroxy-6-hydroxymethyldihydropteridine diphosphokinase [Methyloterricola oryzae]